MPYIIKENIRGKQMTEKILSDIEYNTGVFPLETLQYAVTQKDKIIPELLDILDYTCTNAEELAEQEDYFAHIYAMFLLAQFREPRAYSKIFELVKKPGDIPYHLLGGVITGDLSKLLASVCDGDTELIKQLIEDDSIEDEYVRGDAIKALVVLVANGIKSRDEIMEYFKSLYRGKLKREFSQVWNALVYESCALHPLEVIEDIRQAYEEDLVDPFYIGLEDVEEYLKKNQEDVHNQLKTDRQYSLIDDIIKELSWWDAFNEHKEKSTTIDTSKLINLSLQAENSSQMKIQKTANAQPIITGVKIGRNEPCPCGSGKKYKKCCGK